MWYITVDGDMSIFPWFIFPLVGWGIGIVAHGVGVFAGGPYKDLLTQKGYENFKKKQR